MPTTHRDLSINVLFELKLYDDDLLIYMFKHIAVLVKGRAIHLSYVVRCTDIFCLVYKWNCMRPIVARLNPIVLVEYTSLLQRCINIL